MTVQWTDVTGWQTLWSPDDGTQVTAAVLAQLEDGHQAGATLYSSQFGFTQADIASVMGEWGAAVPDNRYLFDASQFLSDRAERPLVEQIIAPLRPEQWAIGTAPDGSDILHSKVLAILYPDGRGWTFSGSFNLTHAAEREFNVVDLVWSRQRAEAFASQIATRLAWCRANQPQPPTHLP